MADFLLELRSEEIPARMQQKACADLERLFAAALADAGVEAERLTTHATPRRLALIARGLPAETAAVSEERRGPRTDAPDKALDGFLRSTGLTRDDLEAREEKKGSFWYARIETPGRDMATILAQAVPDIVRNFPWPKSMRWGAASVEAEPVRWVRPLQGIVALLDGEVVPFEIAGIASGRTTRGHRFMSSGDFEIADADDYADRLAAAHVILSADERQDAIFAGATEAADEAGLTLIEDAELLSENAGLTEWPVPLLGRFDEEFLQLPPEVIQLAMKTHQKYFAVADADGTLTNAFVCTANIEAADNGRRIVAGNEKVLAARLSDARFFWDQDRKTRLEQHAERLKDIVFHEKLGTVADKVDRVAKLARWLVEEGIIAPAAGGSEDAVARLADQAERAARLAKADLVAGMVYEFPELQGIMGGYYARAQGEDDAVADAVRDHYKPVGQSDDVPTAPVTVAVSLADKFDTLVSMWSVGEKPTGSKDPFALRRSALAIIRLLVTGPVRLPLMPLLQNLDESAQADRLAYKSQKISGFGSVSGRISTADAFGSYDQKFDHVAFEVLDFFADRLKVQQREAGVRHDLIDAVFALGGEDDIVRLLARVKALQAFMDTPEGPALLAGYKRAANILKKEKWTARERTDIPETGEEDPLVLVDDPAMKDVVAAMVEERAHHHLGYDAEPAEADLIAALDKAEPSARKAVDEERFEDAMAALAALRVPIDAFFEQVTVNDEDAQKRDARLALLARVRDAVHRVADFSQIEG
jgi:glycyl-tRNA synthetase beta chain|tara:strand:+ start:52892 stop:55180 length:2289 start_codon:yes stop_codon:yes gene_type:complete